MEDFADGRSEGGRETLSDQRLIEISERLRGATVLCRTMATGKSRLLGILNSLGMTLIQRSSPSAFFQALSSLSPRLVLLDLTSDAFSDLEVAFQLAEMPHAPPMVAVGRPEDYKFAMALSAAEFLALPFDWPGAVIDIAQRMNAALTGQSALAEHCHFDPATCGALQIRALRMRLKHVQAEADRDRTALSRSRSVKNDLMHAISSEFITPLSPVMLYLQMVQQKKFQSVPPEFQAEALEHALQCAETLRRLILSIQEFAALDQDSSELMVRSLFPLRPRLERILDSVRFSRARQKHVTLRLNIRSDGVPEAIETDADKVSKVVSALLSNAVRRATDGTLVCLDVSLQNGCLTFSVFDEGKVPSEEAILQMTDLYRPRSSYDRLSIDDLQIPTAKKQAELLGGHLSFEVPPFELPPGMHARSFGLCQIFALPIVVAPTPSQQN